MKDKTPVTILKEATAPTVAAKSPSSGNFRDRAKSEPIRRAATLSASEEKRMLNEKLLTSAWNGDIKEVWDLLDKGADVNTRNHRGETPLISAAHGGHPETVELLLEKKANINAVDNEGNTALMLACCFKQIEVILVLLAKGADVGISNKNGWTPLKYLVRLAKDNKDIMNVLEHEAIMQGMRIRVTFKPNGPAKNNNNKRTV